MLLKNTIAEQSAFRNEEFFDDEIDSIRQFDVMNQRSQQNLKEAVIPPASEAPVPAQGGEEFAARLRTAMKRQTRAMNATKDGDQEASLADLPLEEGEVAVPASFTRESRTMERFQENVENRKVFRSS